MKDAAASRKLPAAAKVYERRRTCGSPHHRCGPDRSATRISEGKMERRPVQRSQGPSTAIRWPDGYKQVNQTRFVKTPRGSARVNNRDAQAPLRPAYPSVQIMEL